MRIRIRRRRFSQLMIASPAAAAAALANFATKTRAQTSSSQSPTTQPQAPTPASSTVNVTLRVNGTQHRMQIEPRVTLLDTLRERLDLTGTKKGCNHGQCGACTIFVNGWRINSCLALACMHEGDEITTVEGLARGDELHPVQAAFIKHDGFQCGYCTPGQICSAVALLGEVQARTASAVTADVRQTGRVELTDAEIKERMSGESGAEGGSPSFGNRRTRRATSVAERLLTGARAEPATFLKAAEATMREARGYEHNRFKIEMGKRAIVRALTTVTEELI